ncbi:MAG: hypothetical protein R2688_01410 [Fimbriimonadaceae bacterium]
MLSENGYDIQTVRLGQWAGSASAAFYVRREDNEPVDAKALAMLFD